MRWKEPPSYLKPQLSGTSSLRRTSLRLPFGQYSVTMATLGTSTQPPINLHRLGWSSSLELERERETQNSIFGKAGRSVRRDVCVLPDLFDFLSDGFGQREGLWLNPLDGHRPAVTGGGNYIKWEMFSENLHQSPPVCRCPSVDLFITVKWAVHHHQYRYLGVVLDYKHGGTWAGFTSWGGSGPSMSANRVLRKLYQLVTIVTITGYRGLTISQCRWTWSSGSLVVLCGCWVRSHSWCYCRCSPPVHSWCCPWSYELHDL